MCPAFHREQATAVKIPEVAERKLVSGFRIFGMRFVDPKIPFAIFSESVHANEFVLRLRHRMMISPRIFLINDRPPLSDQFLCKSERVLISCPALSFAQSRTV